MLPPHDQQEANPILNDKLQIFIFKNGLRTGPFTEMQAYSMLSAGMITYEDLAWAEGEISAVLRLSQPPPISNPSLADSSDGPKGLGGWLLFFCVVIFVLPFVPGGLMNKGWEEALPAIDAYPAIRIMAIWELASGSVIEIYGFVVSWIICSGSTRGRDIARKYLQIRLIGFIGIKFISLFLINELSPYFILAEIFQAAVYEILGEAVYFAIWWMYFKKSKRVRNTYETS